MTTWLWGKKEDELWPFEFKDNVWQLVDEKEFKEYKESQRQIREKIAAEIFNKGFENGNESKT